MLSLPPELQRLVICHTSPPSLCRLRECGSDYKIWMDTPSFLSCLLEIHSLISPSSPTFPSCLFSIVARHFPFLSPLGSHQLVTRAIDQDDPIALDNACRDLDVRIRCYYPSIMVGNKKRIASFLSCDGVWEDDGVSLDKKVEHCLELARSNPQSPSAPILGNGESFFAKYVCSREGAKHIFTTNRTNKTTLLQTLTELNLEKGNVVQEVAKMSNLSFRHCRDLENNYDYPELVYPITAGDLGPNKPRLLKRFLEHNYNKGMRREAAVMILRSLSNDITCYDYHHLDPYDEQVFTFLTKYVTRCLRDCDDEIEDIDSVLGLNRGIFLEITNTAIKHGRVKILKWILTTFSNKYGIRYTIHHLDIPVSSRLVLSKYPPLKDK